MLELWVRSGKELINRRGLLVVGMGVFMPTQSILCSSKLAGNLIHLQPILVYFSCCLLLSKLGLAMLFLLLHLKLQMFLRLLLLLQK